VLLLHQREVERLREPAPAAASLLASRSSRRYRSRLLLRLRVLLHGSGG